MTAEQLIEQLSKYPGDRRVVVLSDHNHVMAEAEHVEEAMIPTESTLPGTVVVAVTA